MMQLNIPRLPLHIIQKIFTNYLKNYSKDEIKTIARISQSFRVYALNMIVIPLDFGSIIASTPQVYFEAILHSHIIYNIGINRVNAMTKNNILNAFFYYTRNRIDPSISQIAFRYYAFYKENYTSYNHPKYPDIVSITPNFHSIRVYRSLIESNQRVVNCTLLTANEECGRIGEWSDDDAAVVIRTMIQVDYSTRDIGFVIYNEAKMILAFVVIEYIEVEGFVSKILSTVYYEDIREYRRPRVLLSKMIKYIKLTTDEYTPLSNKSNNNIGIVNGFFNK